MARKPKIERFNEKILSRFQIYNSLFLTLPFKNIKNLSGGGLAMVFKVFTVFKIINLEVWRKPDVAETRILRFSRFPSNNRKNLRSASPRRKASPWDPKVNNLKNIKNLKNPSLPAR